MEKFRFYLPPLVSESEAKQVVERLYGLKVQSCKELNSYVDKNFHVFVDPESLPHNDFITNGICNDGYVLKILNAPHSENKEYIDGISEMIKHLIMNGLHCQQIIQTVDGKERSTERFRKANSESGEFDTCIVRLFTFLPGQILNSINATSDLLYQEGQLVANVTNALQSFHHPAFDNLDKFWNVRNINLLEEFLQFLPDQNKVQLVRDAMKLFSENVEPYCDQLPKSVIHNDLSDQNLITRPKFIDQEGNIVYKIYGILDFDEAQMNCSVFELSASLVYMMVGCTIPGIDDLLHIGSCVIAGYLSKRQLSDLEFEFLIPAIAARLSASLCCGAYNYHQTKNEYSLATSLKGWTLLETILRTPKEQTHKLWKKHN